MMEERFWFLFTRYLSKESSLEENEELQDIISSEQKYKHLFEHNSAIWNARKISNAARIDKDRIKNKVFDSIRKETTTTLHKSAVPYWRYAAIIVFVMVFGYILVANLNHTEQIIEPVTLTKNTGDNQRAMFTLPDGTEVWLHENSSISYLEEFTLRRNRHVQLVGEAYFNVSRNIEKPFIVKTGEVSTRVLGTRFNVRAFPNKDVEVTVEAGKVLVESQYKGIALEPNEQATVNLETNDIFKNRVNSEYVTIWRNPEMELDMVSLREAFFIMERYYNVDIMVDDRADLSCTVRSMYKNENLETVLQGLQLIFNFNYKIIDKDKIQIIGAGC